MSAQQVDPQIETPRDVRLSPQTAYVHCLPVSDYGVIWHWQKRLVAARHCGRLNHDLFLVLQHAPVMTLGRSGRLDHLLIAPASLSQRGVALYQTERGGEITYHGPGQLVVYGICDLSARPISLRDYVQCLETVMLRVVRRWGVGATTSPQRPGIWVGCRKLGSLGIAVRHGIAYHGLALNVDLDLTPFSWISPCGYAGLEMTSLALQTGEAVTLAAVEREMIDQLQQVLKLQFSPWPDDEELNETNLAAAALSS